MSGEVYFKTYLTSRNKIVWSRVKNIISIFAAHSFILLGLCTFAQAQSMLGDALVGKKARGQA